MTHLLLVPLDDTVVFPTMDVTLPIDVGDEERVLLVPRHDRRVRDASARSPRSSTASACPAAAAPWRSTASPAASPARPSTDPPAACASRSTERPDDDPGRRPHARARARVPRRRRGDPRAARRRRPRRRVPALDHRARRAGRHIGYAPDLTYEQKVELLETLDVTERLELARQAPARAAGRAAGAPADPRRRPVRRREAAARVLPAQADGVDPQGARRGRRARSSRSTARRSRRPTCPTRSREQAERRSWAASSAWASSPARPR